MKKVISVTMSILLTLSVVACSNSKTENPSQGTTTPTPTVAPPIPTSETDAFSEAEIFTETSKPTIDYPLKSFEKSYSNDDGYSADVEIKLGAWIKGTDDELLQQAWESVGGIGEVPIPIDIAVKEKTALAIGVATVKNTTTGWDLKNLILQIVANPSLLMHGEYPTGDGCFAARFDENTLGIIDKNSSLFGWYICANSISVGDIWGPVPFVFSNTSVFDPANPDGKPEFLEKKFQFSINGTLS